MQVTPDVAGPGAARDFRALLTIASLARATGGPAVTVSCLGRELAARGVAVGVLVGKRATELKTSNVQIPVKYVGRGLRRHRCISTAGSFFQGEPPDLVHDNGLWLAFNHRVAAMTRQLGIPRIVSPHGMLEPWAIHQKVWKKKLAWHSYQRRDLDSASLIHATAHEEAENLRRLGLTRPIGVIPNAVELPGPDKLRCKDRQSNGIRSAVFLSRIHPKKGLLNLIEAWSSVRPSEWELIIAGPDERGHRKEIEQAARRLGLEDVIRLTGPIYGSEKDDLFCQADLFILPTFSENFGIVVAEALGWRVPVITTKGAPWGALEAERCGWWTEIGVEPLSEAIRQATALPDEERQAMGERGRALVEREFSWPRIAGLMLTVYRWVLGSGPQPGCVRLE